MTEGAVSRGRLLLGDLTNVNGCYQGGKLLTSVFTDETKKKKKKPTLNTA